MRYQWIVGVFWQTWICLLQLCVGGPVLLFLFVTSSCDCCETGMLPLFQVPLEEGPHVEARVHPCILILSNFELRACAVTSFQHSALENSAQHFLSPGELTKLMLSTVERPSPPLCFSACRLFPECQVMPPCLHFQADVKKPPWPVSGWHGQI